jgi:hypothetical protein
VKNVRVMVVKRTRSRRKTTVEIVSARIR